MTDTRIPLLDLKAQYDSISSELEERVIAVMRSMRYIMGPEVAELETEMAGYTGAAHAVGVASGTDALLLGLKAIGVKPGDEVITTPFTFYSTASTIVHAGAVPVFVDIDPETCLIDPGRIEEAVNKRTRAIVPVHLFGQCADMESIGELASRRLLSVLEDACQAAGAGYKGKSAGSMGDAGALSFYPSKNLGGMGDGGMALTNDDKVAERLRLLRVHGAAKEYRHEVIGYNSRLDTVQAAVLLVKLEKLDEWKRARARNAALYDELFADGPVRPLAKIEGGDHVYNNYVIRSERRDELMEYLKGRGIGCAVYYPAPLHHMACFSRTAIYNDCAEAERAAREVLAIPVYPEMTEEMVRAVADAIKDFHARG